ncbi:MAG: flagellar protein FlgN [Rhodomicrobium sp.]
MTRSPAISERTKAALFRLEKALDQENEALAAFDSRNLSEYSRIKTQSLLELQRSATVLSREDVPAELLQLLTTLRQKLEVNRWLLLLHLEAAREVTTVITSAIRDAESDGTYSRVSNLRKVAS